MINWKNVADEYSLDQNELAEEIFKMAAFLAEEMTSANPKNFPENKVSLVFGVKGKVVECIFSVGGLAACNNTPSTLVKIL